MDLRFTPQELAFRDEVRGFMRASLPEPIRRKMVEGRHLDKDDIVAWQRILNAKGWAVPHWPVEYGGQDWTPGATIYLPGRAAAGAGAGAACRSASPWSGRSSSPSAAPSRSAASCRVSPISTIGGARDFPSPAPAPISPRSRPRRSASGIITSSPARRPGRRWRSMPTGSSASSAPIRQAKKQEGITFLLIDMRAKGITVRPIVTIDGGSEVNEVFFDEVIVPVENRVGAENKGWDYAKFLLGNERTRSPVSATRRSASAASARLPRSSTPAGGRSSRTSASARSSWRSRSN